MKPPQTAWLDAGQVVELLGVSRATLYAYVSRGRIRSEAASGGDRRRRYARDDVERLLARTRETYDGPVEVGEDLMSFEIGGDGQIITQRHAAPK